ncbi:hypothetical protein NP233_g1347 [Leucocoprinus birnbaumii]|uniref:DM2 domain-containing protein n=1 Tax=Leucocoprinus birnbaumii TaxID=56174 RepID=A0AAD5W077_9AGAR|nr:hypothetical protein NP233_g1347 [Leucocoprinus birnbaumii]
MSLDVSALEPTIRAILSAPGVDLATISAKRVRKQLMGADPALTPEIVKEHKDEIDSLISQVFEEISGTQQDSDDEDDTQSNKRKKGDEEEGDEDVEQERKPPKKKKAKGGQEESDAKLARKLSNEINGRATRGAGKSRSNGSTKKGGRSKKSASTIDSDDEGDGEGKKKKRAGGGFGKEYNLSEPLSNLLQVDKMSRPQIVKGLWNHIKENQLQNPNNKREIICDPSMKAIFNVDKIDMFQMNKVLGQYVFNPSMNYSKVAKAIQALT